GDAVLAVKLDPTSAGASKLFASAAYDRGAREVILKVVNASSEPCDLSIQLEGARSVKAEGTATVLAGENLSDENTLTAPTKISPHSVSIHPQSPSFRQNVAARSLTVLRVGL